MILDNHKLGEFIYEIDRKNIKNDFGMDRVRGISNTKQIMKTKADVDESVLHKFYIINPGEFIYNPRTTRMGEKVGLAFNDTNEPLLFSFNNIAFGIKDEAKDKILPEYLYIYYNRPEFDRYAIKNSWGSATEIFSFDEMCDIDIEIPDIEIQKKYVEVYKSMIENQKNYERGLEDLKLTCDAYIENVRRKKISEPIGIYIKKISEKNIDKKITKVMGLSTKKEFREPQSRVNKDELKGYKIVHENDIAYVPTTDTWKVLAFSVNHFKQDIVVSPIYEVFSVNNDRLLSDYLAIWLRREEFDRYARFNSWGSARENFSFDEMCEVKIPIPDIEIQQDIVKIYKAYILRKEINEKLKEQIKIICPILIKGSLEEAKSN